MKRLKAAVECSAPVAIALSTAAWAVDLALALWRHCLQADQVVPGNRRQLPDGLPELLLGEESSALFPQGNVGMMLRKAEWVG